ncbi:hypothetical protein B9Z19DRAFT_1073218 [Tuber borchii]|uniref:Uncharacterized protein n=1 Tax=Tuber borchii TaxID=42251 RepID=A0A2T7A630_TUBBO|nr:hypothetical protein B9Z19DRAFT_1073218 [Tuber borchii]
MSLPSWSVSFVLSVSCQATTGYCYYYYRCYAILYYADPLRLSVRYNVYPPVSLQAPPRLLVVTGGYVDMWMQVNQSIVARW